MVAAQNPILTFASPAWFVALLLISIAAILWRRQHIVFVCGLILATIMIREVLIAPRARAQITRHREAHTLSPEYIDGNNEAMDYVRATELFPLGGSLLVMVLLGEEARSRGMKRSDRAAFAPEQIVFSITKHT